jgi:hypothetical protein
MLWRQLYDSADSDWIRTEATRRLTQLQALDEIDQLIAAARRFYELESRPPASWQELVDARMLSGIPLDPTARPYVIDSVNGTINVSEDSSLFPLPGETLPPLPQ